MSQELHILTGAPGTGKTAVLGQLTVAIRRMNEPAREILAEHRSREGGEPQEISTERFADLLLQRSIDKYEQALEWSEAVVFDRGIPDCVTYALHLGRDPQPAIDASRTHRYNEDVLILEPWEEIYTTDTERQMTFSQVMSFHQPLEEAYRMAGYTLVPVPVETLNGRGAFVERFVWRA